MLEHLIQLLAVLASTAGAYFFMRVLRRECDRSLRQVAAEVMECIGVFVVFLAVNVVLGVVAILLVRSIAGVFLSLYVMDDLTLIVLSGFQGFIFRLWWRPQYRG